MSVSAIPSPSTADNSLLASLGVSASTGNSITGDLQAYEQAKSSGNASSADAAIVQLKSDLQSEMQQLLTNLESSASTGTAGSGDDLLDGVLSSSNNTTMSSLLASIQSMSAQGAQSAALIAGTDDTDAPISTGTQMNVDV